MFSDVLGLQAQISLSQPQRATPQCVTATGGQEALEVPWERKHYKILQRGGGRRGMEREKENCQYIAFQTG